MKGLILSGGKGTRLRPITHTSAKQLVPIANKPILYYAIDGFKDAGITEIGIIVGDTHEEIRLAVGNGAHWGVNITYIHQDAPLGLAHAVKIAEPFIKDEPFIMFLGDNLIKDGVKKFVEEFKKKDCNAYILLAEVDRPEQYGVAELSEGRVVRLVEKPRKPKTNLAVVGAYLFDSSIFKAVNAIQPSHRNELEITDAIQYLVDNKYEVHSHIISGWWKDTGRLEDMLEANRITLDVIGVRNDGFVDADSKIHGRVIIEKGAEIINSTIRGPAIIGERSRIINSFIGPYTSIYYDTLVLDSEIEHSIILESSKVEDIKRLEGSLIGKNVVINRSQLKPRAYRFMVGDNSHIGIL